VDDRDKMPTDRTVVIKRNRAKEDSPLKGYETQRKKTAENLWQAYFKNPLENMNIGSNKKSQGPASGQKLNDNIKRLKEGFLRLPNMMKKYKTRREY